MAITYPRTLPGCVRLATLTLVENVVPSPSGKGLVINRSQVNDPVWRLSLSTAMMHQSDAAEWISWKNSLRGGLRTFVASDSRRPAPLAYPTATAPGDVSSGWSGAATVTSVGTSGALGLSGLPTAYQFKAGDRIGLEQGSPLRRGYYEVLEDVTASGGAATVTVAPFLHTGIFTTSATARIWRPTCELVIDWQSWTETEGDIPTFAAISFEAWQKL